MAVIHGGKFMSLSLRHGTWLKWRQAIEPLIGHARPTMGGIGAGTGALRTTRFMPYCALPGSTSAGCCGQSRRRLPAR